MNGDSQWSRIRRILARGGASGKTTKEPQARFRRTPSMAVDITALYCCLDDFGKVFADWEAHRLLPSEQTRQRSGKLSRAEMLFIVVLFHLSPYKNFKVFYLYGIGGQYRACFDELPHYDRFVSLMPRLFVPLTVLLHGLSGEQTGVYFGNSTKLAVCHNRRIHRHKGLRWPGRARQDQHGMVLRPQAALRDQPQRPDHGAEDHPRQHRRQHRAGRDNPPSCGQAVRRQGLHRPRTVPQTLAAWPTPHHSASGAT